MEKSSAQLEIAMRVHREGMEILLRVRNHTLHRWRREEGQGDHHQVAEDHMYFNHKDQDEQDMHCEVGEQDVHYETEEQDDHVDETPRPVGVGGPHNRSMMTLFDDDIASIYRGLVVFLINKYFCHCHLTVYYGFYTYFQDQKTLKVPSHGSKMMKVVPVAHPNKVED